MTLAQQRRKPSARHPWRGPVFINGRRSESDRRKATLAAKQLSAAYRNTTHNERIR